MGLFFRILVASLVAALVPSVLFFLFFLQDAPDGWAILFIAWLVILGILVVFGLPVFFLLRAVRRLSCKWVVISGFLLGCALDATLNFPACKSVYASRGTWFGKSVLLCVDGSPTTYAWLKFVQGCLITGVLGAVVAYIFFLIWRVFEGKARAIDNDI